MYSIHGKLCLRFKCYSSEGKGILAGMVTTLEGKVILAVRSQAKPIALFWWAMVFLQECSLCSSLTRAFIALLC